jgi:alkaline phosphatase D
MRTAAVVLAALSAIISASYHGNLNYRSPSVSHDGLGIDLSKVKDRMSRKRDVEVDPSTLRFTHGVASVCMKPRTMAFLLRWWPRAIRIAIL